MNYLSVCSGIEAATAAWHPLGWKPFAFSEIEAFPSAVLAHHYPKVPNLGDMTKFQEWPDAAINVLVGGTPCQSFSVAGLRKGMADPRGNLALTFLAIAERYRPEWVVWENVPGVLSSNGGRDFGAFLGGLVELGYGFAYRVLDAQYFGVPQRRRRVFVVGCLGGWQRPAAVLLERESLRGNPAPSREAGEDVAKCLTRGAMQRLDFETETMIPVAFDWYASRSQSLPITEECPPLKTTMQPAIAWSEELTASVDCAGTIQRGGDGGRHDGVMTAGMQVRRLIPRECERLQGFPDDYTLIPWRNKSADQCPDGPRYKALGNSMAVPVMRWIGERIQTVNEIRRAA